MVKYDGNTGFSFFHAAKSRIIIVEMNIMRRWAQRRQNKYRRTFTFMFSQLRADEYRNNISPMGNFSALTISSRFIPNEIPTHRCTGNPCQYFNNENGFELGFELSTLK